MTTMFQTIDPWPKPAKDACVFYHSMTYPDGEKIEGAWDISGEFDQYIGHFPIAGKTVLDVGTAGGFLAFQAEQAGASVTALDALRASEFDRIHFAESLYHLDRAKHVALTEQWLTMLKNGFWYSWHKFASDVEVVYAPLVHLPYWDRKFDVVIAGAILEHLADPVSTIGNLAFLAKEAVIIAFTPVIDSPTQFMETCTDWKHPGQDYTFWALSAGLYHRVFENLGFSVEMLPAKARLGGHEYVRPTLVARRNPSRKQVDAHQGDSKIDSSHFHLSPTSLRQSLDGAADRQDALVRELDSTKLELQTARKENADLRLSAKREIDSTNLALQAARMEISELRRSTSWTLTSPLRTLSSAVRTRHRD